MSIFTSSKPEWFRQLPEYLQPHSSKIKEIENFKKCLGIDDFSLSMYDDTTRTTHDIKLYGSRGQQRLAILQLKLLELLYIEKELGLRPVLLLDDIFSELDEEHIKLVLEMIGKQQTIISTAHKELIPNKVISRMKIIEFEK